MDELPRGRQLKHYRLIAPLGRGGMGIVYRAIDDRLGREVAVKMISGLPNRESLARFWREARSAASVNHPNVCQIFDVDESPEGIFLAMELLEGEALDARLQKGPIRAEDAAPIACGVLGALGALHARGLVHRDIKPSNIFLTPHGPKVLDFGLARSIESDTVRLGGVPDGAVTEAGMIIGTPSYMAPEQVTGASVDERTDLYAVGAVLFHMLAGRPPFAGAGVDAMFAAVHHQPPALEGPPAVIAIDRIIRRAMHKDPGARYQDARTMAEAVSAISLSGATAHAVPIGAMTRVVVPPIRLAKPDPDTAFLSFSLAEAVSGSLAALDHIIVRSPAVAARQEESADPRRLAVDADVDLVISTRLLRSGTQLRLTAQLLDSMGTVLASTIVNGTIDDIFALEDALSSASVRMISAHSTGLAPSATKVARRDVPASPRAFELFLRGLEYARQLHRITDARDVLLEAVAEDPTFAPAWAALGRAHRVFGKFYGDRQRNVALAEDAFRRALELSPDLPAAHNYLTHLEAEMGRADGAIARLLRHAQTNRRDPQLFAGLVHASRYCGLIDASLAAHDEARRLDPNVPTGVEYARVHQVVTGEDAARRAAAWRPGDTIDGLWPLIAFGLRTEPAIKAIVAFDRTQLPPVYRTGVDAIVALASEPSGVAIEKLEAAVAAHDDAEGLFFYATAMISAGAVERGLAVLEHTVKGDYAAVDLLERCFAYDQVRSSAAFARILAAAREGRERARAAFVAGGGPELLGLR